MHPRYTNPRAESKNSILFETLTQIFGDKMNLARIKFFGLFICAICKVQTVSSDHGPNQLEIRINRYQYPGTGRSLSRGGLSGSVQDDAQQRQFFYRGTNRTHGRVHRTVWR